MYTGPCSYYHVPHIIKFSLESSLAQSPICYMKLCFIFLMFALPCRLSVAGWVGFVQGSFLLAFGSAPREDIWQLTKTVHSIKTSRCGSDGVLNLHPLILGCLHKSGHVIWGWSNITRLCCVMCHSHHESEWLSVLIDPHQVKCSCNCVNIKLAYTVHLTNPVTFSTMRSQFIWSQQVVTAHCIYDNKS